MHETSMVYVTFTALAYSSPNFSSVLNQLKGRPDFWLLCGFSRGHMFLTGAEQRGVLHTPRHTGSKQLK